MTGQVIELPTAKAIRVEQITPRQREMFLGLLQTMAATPRHAPTAQFTRRERGTLVDFLPKNPAAKHFATIGGKYDQSLTAHQLREIDALGYAIEVDGVRV